MHWRRFHRAVQLGTVPLQLHGHHGVGAAVAGEAGGLGEGAELDGTGSGALDLIDGVGHILLGDEGLIGGVVEDDGAVGVGVVHPRLQLLLGGYRAGGVVGEAQVDDVHLLLEEAQG